MSFPNQVIVNILWDDESNTYYTVSEDVIGLNLIADTAEEILNILPETVTDLMLLNKHHYDSPSKMPNVPIELLIQQRSTLSLVCA